MAQFRIVTATNKTQRIQKRPLSQHALSTNKQNKNIAYLSLFN